MSDLTVAQQLVAGWIPHFASADRAIRWGNIEKEHSLWLDEHTLLVGRIDADGHTEDGEFFFADWKSLGARKRIGEVKAEYKLDPQMLTYGVLTAPQGGRFLVRWAQKTARPSYHHEWYSYSAGEIAWWRTQLIDISAKIRADKATAKPFVTNLTHCLRYGQAYACPNLANGCSKQDWDQHVGMTPRVSHLEIERKLMGQGFEGVTAEADLGTGQGTMPLILDATRTETWLECPEKYRKKYIENWAEEPGEALVIGIEMHDMLHRYYQGLKEKQNG